MIDFRTSDADHEVQGHEWTDRKSQQKHIWLGSVRVHHGHRQDEYCRLWCPRWHCVVSEYPISPSSKANSVDLIDITAKAFSESRAWHFYLGSLRIVEDVPIMSEDVRENFRRCSQFFSRFWESLEEVPLFCVHCSFLALGWVYVYFESVSVKANAAQSFQWGVIDLSASLSWHVRGFFHPQAC